MMTIDRHSIHLKRNKPFEKGTVIGQLNQKTFLFRKVKFQGDFYYPAFCILVQNSYSESLYLEFRMGVIWEGVERT